MNIVSASLLGLLLVASVSAHSWVQCTDYTQENGRLWDQSNCRAWPRGYQKAFGANGAFAADVGYNYQPGNGAACSKPPTTTDYTTEFPMASYNPGQRVCLAWPPKNHVAANCNNANIGDAGTRIYRSGLNPTADPSLSDFRKNLIFDFGANKGVAGDGFQNCPNFCAKADGALCTGCFDIPKDLALGKYTFLWEWAFNGPADIYTTCFEVDIVANSGNYVKQTYAHQSPDAYKTLIASGQADTPTNNAAPSITGGGGGSGSGGGGGGGSGGGDNDTDGKKGSGLSPGGSAALALFIIAFVAVVVGSVLFVKLGYGTIDKKFPFYHRKTDTTSHYVAYKDTNNF